MIESSASMLAAPGEVQTGGTQPFMPTQTQAPKERGKGKGKAKEESSLLMGLKAAFQLMRKKIISSPKDHVGIIVYNTVRRWVSASCFAVLMDRSIAGGGQRGGSQVGELHSRPRSCSGRRTAHQTAAAAD